MSDRIFFFTDIEQGPPVPFLNMGWDRWREWDRRHGMDHRLGLGEPRKDPSRDTDEMRRFALRHPFYAAVGSAIIMGGWCALISGTWRAVAVGSGGMFIFVAIMWFPRIGPFRLFVRSRIDDD